MANSVQFDDLPGSLPPNRVPEDVDLLQVQQVTQQALESFNKDAFNPGLPLARLAVSDWPGSNNPPPGPHRGHLEEI